MDLIKITEKWQKSWEKAKIFHVKSNSKKKKFYCLEMFPYPSGSGLHMGHAKNYSIGDIYARYKRMKGFNVLYPMGYDSFGLPAENAAIKSKTHPRTFTESAIKNFIQQQKQLGLSYDWSRCLSTHQPQYYQWNQWIFLQLFKKGLAYKKQAPVNWCPECKTVLANEQVHDGKCWRHATTEVEIKELEQWFFKTTQYAEELLKDIDKLEWPERIKIMQRNWIGKSSGTLVNFRLKNNKKIIPVFTTRPDTLYGVTFLVYAPEHPDVMELVKGTKHEAEVKKFIKKVIIEEKFSRSAEDKEKEGLFLGKYAINPINNEQIPIYIANFVLMDYGTGTIMAVPAHDQRDFEFAKKYKIPIKIVIQPHNNPIKELTQAYINQGVLVNSGKFNNLDNESAKREITQHLEKIKQGNSTTQYKLRDWLISRQRYWGTPIPIIYCNSCGIQPIPEKDLPVKLPEDVKFGGEGNPILTSKKFQKVSCPKCSQLSRRETDTMDTFVDSSWYFLRYCSPNNKKELFNKKDIQYWNPVDQYIGGAEHAVMHLLYARFFTKALRDLKLLNFDEPFIKLFNQGMLHKDGFVMSKSRGNVITQEEISKKYGIDTARIFLNFGASPEKDMEWSDKGIEGTLRFINKLISLAEPIKNEDSIKDKIALSKINKLIKQVDESINKFEYNLALNNLMAFVNYLSKYRNNISKKAFQESYEKLILLFSPFTPHISEELWHQLGNKTFASLQSWPKQDIKKINEEAEKEEASIEKLIDDINQIKKITNNDRPKAVYIYVIPKELSIYEKSIKEIESLFSCRVTVQAINDKSILHQEKAKKAKPNKPAIFME